MGVGETHALGGQTVKVRGGDFRVLVVAAEIAVTEIVGKD
jgi:hypothetical protein